MSKLDFSTLARTGQPLLLPGAHDALSARLIEQAGFPAYGIGGAALAATQLALPDLGLQSFGEYRDAVGRVMEGSSLPVMVDGENGFGDVKAVTRTVRTFSRMGIAATAFEDLRLPVCLNGPPALETRACMVAKLEAALAALDGTDMQIVGRTDAAYAADFDEALARAKAYEAVGIDGLIVPGVPDAQAYQLLRDAVAIPIIAVVVPGAPWFAPSQQELAQIGIEAAVYPMAMLPAMIGAAGAGLEAVRNSHDEAPSTGDLSLLPGLLDQQSWAQIDRTHAQRPDEGS